jgi:hypothetical protein
LPSYLGCQIASLGLALSLTLACGKATGIPEDASANADSQQLPFDHGTQAPGAGSNGSPLHSVSRLPVGTPVTIRLRNPVSSDSARVGDRFPGSLDENVVIDGQTAVPRGSDVAVRVLAAKASGRRHDPGYLRVAVVSLSVAGKVIPIETSSLFVKGGSHDRHDRAQSGTGNTLLTESAEVSDKVSFDAQRRLTFRLAQAADLP